MKALVVDFTIPRFLITKMLGKASRRAFWGSFSILQYRDIPEPRLQGRDWVRVDVRLGGICGSDLHAIQLHTSPSTLPLSSFPFVVGHENVGVVVEIGPEVTELRVGQRVTVEPALPCAARGFAAPCANCAAGNYNLCLRYTEGHLSPGVMIGYCRDTGGSWSHSFVAHRSQVFPLPDSMSDENGLMAEPMASALHPVLAHPPREGATVLVIGGGVIGQCVIASLRGMGLGARVIALVKYPFQGEMAHRLGADFVVPLREGDAHYDEIAHLTGGVLHRVPFGKRVLIGGADLTFECVGSTRSIDDALRLTRPGGTVILLGQASFHAGVDWTPIWFHELRVTGSYIYGVERWQDRRVRTMEIVLDWMEQGKVDLSPLVTHRFPLEAYPQALETAMGKAESKAFKVAFTPQG